ncbi:hypothetical protein ACHAWO_000562 [Cyclotella atomus]|uniref:Uncharacterized protein n=1 Tax=Cyclotella atomus TaxID=382360 RepID=A0ABD3P755_9STRA
MKTLDPSLPTVDDELIGKISLTPSTICSSFDQTFDFSDSFESRPSSSAAAEKSKLPMPFKLKTPERRRTRRASFSSLLLSASLPPVITPTMSFDILDDEESPKKSSKSPPRVPQVDDSSQLPAKAPSADRRLPIFRVAPLQLRKSRSSPKKYSLSKSFNLSATTSASIANEISIVESSPSYDDSHDVISKNNSTSWFPLIEIKRSRDLNKKTVHFPDDKTLVTIHHITFDWSSAADYFYTSEDIANMKSARYEDAALFRSTNSKNDEHVVDDLDMSRRRSILCIDTLLQTALQHSDDHPSDTSIRGIEHFVFPELQQEMIRKKKEVQSQVLSFCKSKCPDPQGWRLANHSRMYSRWARDVALEKGQAYNVGIYKSQEEDVLVEEDGSNAATNNNTSSVNRMPPRRKGSRSRRASMSCSMPSVGDGATAAAAIQMAFFSAPIYEERNQEEEDGDNAAVVRAAIDNWNRDEWCEEFDEA